MTEQQEQDRATLIRMALGYATGHGRIHEPMLVARNLDLVTQIDESMRNEAMWKWFQDRMIERLREVGIGTR